MLPTSLAQIVQTAFQAQADGLHTATIAKVLTYYSAENQADLEVVVRSPLPKADGSMGYDEPLVLPKVPVMFPRVGSFSVVLPVSAGDTMLVVFLEASVAEWRAGINTGEPSDMRQHSTGYPIAIPGVFPDSNVPSSNIQPGALVVGHNTGKGEAEFRENEIKLGRAAVQFVARGQSTQDQLDELLNKFNTLVTKYNAHAHASFSAPPSAPATSAANTGAVSATVVKAE